METRLRAVGEETVQIFAGGELVETTVSGRRLLFAAWSDGDAADLEFIATIDETSLEDKLATLSDAAASVPVEAEIALRLLWHYASSISHQQYHDIDTLTLRVESVG